MSSKVNGDGSADQDRVISEASVDSRSARFAAQFEAVNDEMVEVVDGCSDDDWHCICPSEGWSFGVVAHHAASALPAFYDIVEKIAIGDLRTPRISLDVVNENNAKHAQEFASVGKPDVLDLLNTHGPRIVLLLRQLNDEQLERTTDAFGGREFSLAQLVEMVVVGHSRMHLASMRAALGD